MYVAKSCDECNRDFHYFAYEFPDSDDLEHLDVLKCGPHNRLVLFPISFKNIAVSDVSVI